MKQQLEKSNHLPLIRQINLKGAFAALDAYELLENIALFILSRIYFMDYLISPFGVAAFSVLFFKKKRPYYVIFSSLGAISSGTPVFFFKYIGAILITMSIQLIFSKELQNKKRMVAALSTLSVFLTGIIYVLTEGFFVFDSLMLLLECAVLFVSFFVFDKALFAIKTALYKNTFEPLGLMAAISLFAALVFSISLTKNFWPLSHIAAIFAILLVSLSYGFGMSVASGAIFGFALCFSTPYPSQMICIYTLSSFFSGLLQRFGRLAVSFSFALSSLITILVLCPEANGILTVSYVAAACLLLFFVPDKILAVESLSLQKSRKEMAMAQKVKYATDLKISEMIDSVDSVGTIFHEVIESLYDTRCDTSAQILRATADAVCSDCSLCKFCWSKEKEKTTHICERMLSSINTKNTLSKKDIPKEFLDMCIRAETFASELNKNCESQKVTKMWAGKVHESKRLVAEQFKNIAMILKNLKESISAKTDFIPEAEAKIFHALNHHGIEVDNVCVRHNNGYSVTLDKMTCDSKSECDSVTASVISEVLEVPMIKEPTDCNGTFCQVTFSQKPKLCVNASISHTTKKNSHTSGDNASVFSLDAGRVAIILADGMGSGEMANFQSSIVVELTKKLLLSGFNLSTCVRLINDILMTNADKDTFSTIDLCVINLYTGVAKFVKTGACVSYLKSQNALDLVNASSLPAGLIQSVEPDFDKKIMLAGDFLVMASDGVTDVLDNDSGNEIFKILDGFLGTPQELSDEILARAVKKSGGMPLDDMTVVACSIEDNKI
ncbi:MAG: SpoIIE family protein phosphatase [Clostridia bacterium]|nr:SpoIIE family protein phosphatase [Clostridia bacterium]